MSCGSRSTTPASTSDLGATIETKATASNDEVAVPEEQVDDSTSDSTSPAARQFSAAPDRNAKKRQSRTGRMIYGRDADVAHSSEKPAEPARWCSTFSGGKETPSEMTEYHSRPERVLHDVVVPYICLPRRADGLMDVDARTLLSRTPLPKGSAAFSSVHIVAAADSRAKAAAESLSQSVAALGKETSLQMWPSLDDGDVVGEYEAFFHITGNLILKGADRSSLLVFVAGAGDIEELAVAAIVGMLPFRGVQVAFVTPRLGYVDPLQVLHTSSGLFEYDAAQPERMGRCSIAALFGPLAERFFETSLRPWCPLKPSSTTHEKPAPFKIGALELPMVTYEGRYTEGVARLASLLSEHFGPSLFPLVAVGQTVDALGYGSDILCALEGQGCPGFYFAHPSGETYKRPDAYGTPELLTAAAAAKCDGRRVVVIAVGGGVNGNSMGTIAAMIGAELVEVPTTLMHYNDATTSAKKAFSLVVDGQILSKNILGTFYLPQLVFCISETFLTLAFSSIHAAVGEATKTMSMLGNARSATGQRDFHNILGASEFASDFTRIIGTVDGFEHLITFLQNTRKLKDEALVVGQELRTSREAGAPQDQCEMIVVRRHAILEQLRAEFHGGIPTFSKERIMAFLTTINEEIISAKAMFLAYSDPFEKYRALLFEYAHTLGHGVEAFMNGLYRRAENQGLEFENAFRLHGQCVGMAVIWAGEMSKRLGHLDGDGYVAHQSLVYLFNRFGGFDFGPIRQLCDDLDVSCEAFCEGVLKVVRRDNKRGYCKCAPGNSVDQLVRDRPGCLLRSPDPSAELRYLVEVSEDSQRLVLERAFEGAFDNVLSVPEGSNQLSFVPRSEVASGSSGEGSSDSGAVHAASMLDRLLRSMYEEA